LRANRRESAGERGGARRLSGRGDQKSPGGTGRADANPCEGLGFAIGRRRQRLFTSGAIMAEKHHPNADDHHSGGTMDISEHVKTWNTFWNVSKWSVIILAALAFLLLIFRTNDSGFVS
jgi:hypothetical protein